MKKMALGLRELVKFVAEQQLANAGETTTLQVKNACRLIQPNTVINQEDVSLTMNAFFENQTIERLNYHDAGQFRIYYIGATTPTTMYNTLTGIMNAIISASPDNPVKVSFIANGSGLLREYTIHKAQMMPIGTVLVTLEEELDDSIHRSFYPHSVQSVTVNLNSIQPTTFVKN